MNEINEAIELSSAYGNLLKQLCDLEIEGKKDSEEYNYLHSFVSDFNKYIIKHVNASCDNLEEFADLTTKLSGYYNITKLPDSGLIPELISNNYFDNAKRIYEQLFEYSLANNLEQGTVDEEKSLSVIIDNPNDIKTLMSAIEEEKNRLYDEFVADNLCMRVRNNLVINTFYDMLVEEIENEEYPELKNELIRFKYRLIHTSPNISFGFETNTSKTEIFKEQLDILQTEYPETFDCLYNIINNGSFEETLIEVAKLSNEKESINKELKTILMSLYLKTLYAINYDSYYKKRMKASLEEYKDIAFNNKTINEVYYSVLELDNKYKVKVKL